jgi:hypothetical protein
MEDKEALILIFPSESYHLKPKCTICSLEEPVMSSENNKTGVCNHPEFNGLFLSWLGRGFLLFRKH